MRSVYYTAHEVNDVFVLDFAVTGISCVMYVPADMYPEKVTSFGTYLRTNELILHLNGDADVLFNGKKLHTTPRSVRFLPAGETSEYIVTRREWGECFDICFTTDRTLSPEAFVLPNAGNEKIEALFRRIFTVWVAKREGYRMRAMSLLYELIYELAASEYAPESRYAVLSPAMDMIDARCLAGDVRVSELAGCCGISESYLKKLFLRRFGLTPKSYITEKRMKYAAELLASKQYSVQEVSDMTGYESASYFVRVFKGHFGMTPGEYAASVEKE